MKLGTVQGLRRFPVKSMAGETLGSALLTTRGIPGDRGWAVFDEARGGVTTAKRIPALRACRARYTQTPDADGAPPPVEVALPDGSVFLTTDLDAGSRLSDFLGKPVSFRSLGPAGADSAPRVTSKDDPPDIFRQLMGLLPDEPLPDMSGFTPEVMQALRDGNYFDAFPLHLFTDTTLRTLAGLAPASAWDERRFRPNILVNSTASGGYPELDWLGRRVRIGDAVIEITVACPRCVMAIQAVGELPRDPQVMRTLVKETQQRAGVYARVVEPGTVCDGDELSFGSQRPPRT